MYKQITENWEFEFSVSERGIYAIEISATCKDGKMFGLFGGEDLRIEIDNIKPREIPLTSKPQYYDIPSAWNGTNLRGTEKTAFFILKLSQGKHVARFIPKRGAQILKEPRIHKLDKEFVLENIQSEEKDRQPWITIALFDLPLNFIDAEFTCQKRTTYDSDDVKLITDGKIQKNGNLTWWGKNWFWQGKVLQGKIQANRFYLGLPRGDHYIEFWADRTPLLNNVNFHIFEEQDDNNPPTPIKPYKTGSQGEDYNRLDSMIVEVVEKWNKEFLNDKYPVEEPLDPNLVKAIIYQESKIGYYPGGEIDVMQVGNQGDPALETLNGELTEYWIQNGEIKKLGYKGEANVDTQYDSIYWGVRWLYHKAQEIRDGKRYWKDWEEAVYSYGPGKDEYAENVWSIYKNGVDQSDPKRSIKLWSIFIFIPLVFNLINYSNKPITANIIENKIINENKGDIIKIKDVEVGFSENNPKLLFAIEEWEKNWWEKLKIGKLEGNEVSWFDIDGPTEQDILSARYVKIEGLDETILEVYGKTHAGNGSLYLYEVNNTGARLILKTSAVDSKNELAATPDNFKKYGFWQCDKVFRNGKLIPEYKGVNHDGIGDVVLSGTSDIICDNTVGENHSDDESNEVVVETNEVKELFLWNSSSKLYEQQDSI